MRKRKPRKEGKVQLNIRAPMRVIGQFDAMRYKLALKQEDMLTVMVELFYQIMLAVGHEDAEKLIGMLVGIVNSIGVEATSSLLGSLSEWHEKCRDVYPLPYPDGGASGTVNCEVTPETHTHTVETQ